MTKAHSNLYIMAVNFDRVKHKELVEWIKKQADLDDRSVSSFCIAAIKEYRKQREAANGQKEN